MLQSQNVLIHLVLLKTLTPNFSFFLWVICVDNIMLFWNYSKTFCSSKPLSICVPLVSMIKNILSTLLVNVNNKGNINKRHDFYYIEFFGPLFWVLPVLRHQMMSAGRNHSMSEKFQNIFFSRTLSWEHYS